MPNPVRAETSPRRRARIAGVFYVLSIVCGFFAEMVVRARLVVYADPAKTAMNILGSPDLYRMGFFADMGAMAFGVLSSVILYTLLKYVSRPLALTVLVLDLVSNTVSLSVGILLFAPLILLQDPLPGFTQSALDSLAILSIKLYELAYSVNLAVFGVSCIVSGYLLFRSTFLPGFLGVLIAIAGACYLTNSFVNFMPPGFGNWLFPWVLMPCVIAEGVLALWMSTVGLDEAKWHQVVAGRRTLEAATK
jgi:hypothetical protein